MTGKMKTMNCNQLRAQFGERLDGRLAKVPRETFDRHVAVCPACGPEWKAYAAAWQVLTRPEDLAPSFGFVERTLRRLDEEPAPARVWYRLPFWRWSLLGAAGAVALTVGVLLWQRHEARRAGELYAAVQATDLVEDFDVIASLDLLEKRAQP